MTDIVRHASRDSFHLMREVRLFMHIPKRYKFATLSMQSLKDLFTIHQSIQVNVIAPIGDVLITENSSVVLYYALKQMSSDTKDIILRMKRYDMLTST